MLLGMIPDMPRILEDAKKWLSKDYKNHLPQQDHRRQENRHSILQHRAHGLEGTPRKTISQMDDTIEQAIAHLERNIEAGNMDLVRKTATTLSRIVQRLMDMTPEIIHGNAETMVQSKIDHLLGN